ncbi:phage tail tape measure protein [Adlercreutzia muris]|uniref:Phage tail tape measure protein domain-containing protein n=1 Tax=Adlercreutzia muris TaxID=1796610 RepID=A0A7C8FNW9_9ACTN|nr:phage tail tape measure protein [Adlercreutzia muris]KAB1647995.1 hypothetical protein F8D48_06800 [Adlercreutzia muris]MCR2027711.1 phage tail tape measure protein [Adlercreutzia muris]
MAKKDEAKIKFSADTKEFSAAIKQAGDTMTQLRGELKLNEAQMANTGQSVEALTKKHDLLVQHDAALAQKIEALNGKLEKAREIWGENSQEAQRYANQITNARTAQERVRGQIEAVSAALDDQREAEQRAESALSKLNATIDEQQAEVSRLADEYKSAVIQYGRTSDEADELESALRKANAALNNSKGELAEVERICDGVADSLNDMSDSALDGKNSIEELAAGTMLADFGEAAIDAATDAVKRLVVESDTAASRIKAAFGGGAAEQFGELEDALNRIYASNYGDSLEDIADAGREVVAVLGNDISTESFEELTTQAIILRDAFDIDVNESIKAANQLMTQFGYDGKAAYDMLAAGCQDGLNANGEWLDAVSEYSVYYEQLGLSAEDMFNTMAAGSKTFLNGTDKAGDAIKEFSIRAIDMSESSKEGFELMGLSADEYAAKIAQGGDVARDATIETVNALLAMKDPIAQNTAGVDLFGTMWEDMGHDGMEAMLGLMGAAADTAGTMDEIDQIRYDNVADQAEGLKRRFEDEMLMPIVEKVQPALMDFFSFVSDNFEWIAPVVTGVAVAFGILGTAMAISGIIQAVTVAMAALNIAMSMNPVVLIVAAIAGLVAAFVLLWNNCEEFRNFWLGLWDGICQAASAAAEWVMANVVTPIGGFFAWLGETVSGIWESISTAAQRGWDIVCNVFQVGIMFIQELLGLAVETFLLPWSFIWENFGGVITQAWDIITSVVGAGIDACFSWIDERLRLIQAVWDLCWGAVSAKASELWSAITSVVGAGIDACFSWIDEKVRMIRSVWDICWGAVSAKASEAWSGIQAIAAAGAGFLDDQFRKIKGAADVVWGAIKGAIVEPVQGAFDKVRGLIDKIKSVFNFKWSLPHLKLPHLNITGGFSINPPSVPNFEIKWYAKGAVFNRPTVLSGVDGKFRGVGEAGPEAIAPIRVLQNYVADAVAASKYGEADRICAAIDRLAGRPTVLNIDGDKFAEATAGPNDRVQGGRQELSERGLAL